MAESSAVLRQARLAAGLTQEELAERSGVPQSSISAYERERHVPSLETLKALVKATGHTLNIDLARLDGRPSEVASTLDVIRARRGDLVAAGAALGVSNIRVFGSVARGEDRPDSDVDLLVDLLEPVGLIGLARIEDAFSDIIGRQVEIVPTFTLRTDESRELLRDAVAL